MITAGFSNLFSRPPHGLRLGLRPNPAIKRRCQESVSQRQRREMLKPGPSAQVQVRSSFRALKARNDRGPTSMANHFAARVAISRFQRLKTHRRSHPGRCPGLLHFAPLALGIQVLTQTLNRWAIFNRPLMRTQGSTFCPAAQRWLARTSRASTVLSLLLSVADKNVSTRYEQPPGFITRESSASS